MKKKAQKTEKVINQEKLNEIQDKIDAIFEKEKLTTFDVKIILQDMLDSIKWSKQEYRFDELVKKLKSKK